jgi:hypothetical protein
LSVIPAQATSASSTKVPAHASIPVPHERAAPVHAAGHVGGGEVAVRTKGDEARCGVLPVAGGLKRAQLVGVHGEVARPGARD